MSYWPRFLSVPPTTNVVVVVQIWHVATLGPLGNTTFHFLFLNMHSFVREIRDDHSRRLFLSIIGFC